MILFFSGLGHHAKKLKPIFNLFDDSKWLFGDNSVNIDPPSKFVPNDDDFIDIRGIPYDEKRVGDVEQAIITNMIHGGFDFPPFWLSQGANELAIFAERFRWLLKNAGNEIKAICILHEVNFWTKVLAYEANLANIPVVSFQEGILRLADQNIFSKTFLSAQYSTLVFCWSENEKQKFIASSIDERKLFVSGVPHISKSFIRKEKDSIKNILIALPSVEVYEGNLAHDLAHIDTWAGTNKGKFNVYVTMHPFYQKQASITLSHCVIPSDTTALLESGVIDLCLSQNSSVIAEAEAMGIKVATLNLSKSFIFEPMVGAQQVCSMGDIAHLDFSKKKEFYTGDLSFIKEKIESLL